MRRDRVLSRPWVSTKVGLWGRPCRGLGNAAPVTLEDPNTQRLRRPCHRLGATGPATRSGPITLATDSQTWERRSRDLSGSWHAAPLRHPQTWCQRSRYSSGPITLATDLGTPVPRPSGSWHAAALRHRHGLGNAGPRRAVAADGASPAASTVSATLGASRTRTLSAEWHTTHRWSTRPRRTPRGPRAAARRWGWCFPCFLVFLLGAHGRRTAPNHHDRAARARRRSGRLPHRGVQERRPRARATRGAPGPRRAGTPRAAAGSNRGRPARTRRPRRTAPRQCRCPRQTGAHRATLAPRRPCLRRPGGEVHERPEAQVARVVDVRAGQEHSNQPPLQKGTAGRVQVGPVLVDWPSSHHPSSASSSSSSSSSASPTGHTKPCGGGCAAR